MLSLRVFELQKFLAGLRAILYLRRKQVEIVLVFLGQVICLVEPAVIWTWLCRHWYLFVGLFRQQWLALVNYVRS